MLLWFQALEFAVQLCVVYQFMDVSDPNLINTGLLQLADRPHIDCWSPDPSWIVQRIMNPRMGGALVAIID